MDYKFRVTVSNVGQVCCTNDQSAAEKAFAHYCEQSMFGHGRCSGETVVLWKDGEVYEEFEQ